MPGTTQTVEEYYVKISLAAIQINFVASAISSISSSEHRLRFGLNSKVSFSTAPLADSLDLKMGPSRGGSDSCIQTMWLQSL